MIVPDSAPQLTSAQLASICATVQRLSGIALHEGKQELVRARLAKRLRALGLASYGEYLELIQRDRCGHELAQMVDALTTNKTSFFREPQHFDHLAQHLVPLWAQRGGRVRLWSAGCSTGEEPYSLAMVLCEHSRELARCDLRILATDLSRRVLAHARRAIYPEEAVRAVDPALVRKYFFRIETPAGVEYRVCDEVRSYVRFARLNLVDPDWPLRGPFDVIFCRNVMIYFDQPTRAELVRRLVALLCPGGVLYVGHSESLSGCNHPLRYVQPAVYVK